MLSLANKEPLIGMESGIDIVWKVIRKDGCNGSNCMVREREAPLCRSRYWLSHKRSSSAKNGDIGHNGGVGGHWWLEVLLSRGSDIDIIRVYGDVVMKWGKEEGIEKFLSDLR